jgi:hypothetical protein
VILARDAFETRTALAIIEKKRLNRHTTRRQGMHEGDTIDPSGQEHYIR